MEQQPTMANQERIKMIFYHKIIRWRSWMIVKDSVTACDEAESSSDTQWLWWLWCLRWLAFSCTLTLFILCLGTTYEDEHSSNSYRPCTAWHAVACRFKFFTMMVRHFTPLTMASCQNLRKIELHHREVAQYLLCSVTRWRDYSSIALIVGSTYKSPLTGPGSFKNALCT